MPGCGAHGFSPAAGVVTGRSALVRAGVIHPSAVGLIEGASTGGRVRPQPHAIQLPMAHFLSILPCPVSLSGWVQGLLTVWLRGWVPCHPPPPAPTSVSLHVHPSTVHILFCSSRFSRDPLLQPLQAAAPDLCKSGVPHPSLFPVCLHRTELIGGPVNLVPLYQPRSTEGRPALAQEEFKLGGQRVVWGLSVDFLYLFFFLLCSG